MTNPKMGPILEDIGKIVAELLDFDVEGAFLYAEAGDRWQSAMVFKDVGEKVIAPFPGHELAEAVERLWEAEPDPAKRWATMRYSILNGQFDARFEYPDQLDPDELSFDRSERVLAEQFGEKLIDYSAYLPDGDANDDIVPPASQAD